MSERDDGGPAFPYVSGGYHPGMSLRDWYMGQALANPEICTGHAPEYMLAKWFPDQTGISTADIAAKQAEAVADAMLKARAG